MNYEQKYLKYKIKYQNLKNLLGGEIINGVDMEVIKEKLDSIKETKGNVETAITSNKANLQTSKDEIKKYTKSINKKGINVAEKDELTTKKENEERRKTLTEASIKGFEDRIKLFNRIIPEIETAINKNKSNTKSDQKSIDLLIKLIDLNIKKDIINWGI
jgi:hypothetical protein